MNTLTDDEKELLRVYKQLDTAWRQCVIKQARILAEHESRTKKPDNPRIIKPHPSVWGRTAVV